MVADREPLAGRRVFMSGRTARVRRWLLALWPQVPLAFFMILAGALNLATGLRARTILLLIPGRFPTTALSRQVSFAALGPSAQALLGAGLILVGIGLLWRYRVAWSFAVLLLLITIAINLANGLHGATLALPGLSLIALLVTQNHFTRVSLLGAAFASLIAVTAVVAYGTIGSFLLGDQFTPRVHNLVTALYFTVVTLSTVGYGDIHPSTVRGQAFVISLVVMGLSVFATAIISGLGPTVSGQLTRFFTPTEGKMTANDHVILVGDGTIARNIARELDRRGIPLVQVVAPDGSPPLPNRPVVQGDPSDDTVLQKAGIANARMVIAAGDNDGENAFVSLAAKDLNSAVRVLAVASSARSIRRLKLARADVAFAIATVGSRLLVDLVEGQSIPEEFRDLVN